MKKHTSKYPVLRIIVSCFMLTLCLFGTNTVTHVSINSRLGKGTEIFISFELKKTITDSFPSDKIIY